MKKSLIIPALLLWAGLANSQNIQKESDMKIKMKFEDKEVIVRMYDNPAVRQIVGLLPAEFEFIDFAGEEKITNFAKPLSLKDAPRGMVASAGTMFMYATWGNMGFFYKDHGTKTDNSLIPLGKIESGLEYLAKQKGGFTAEMSVITGKE